MALHSSLLYILPVLHCLRGDAFDFQFCLLAGVRKNYSSDFTQNSMGRYVIGLLKERLHFGSNPDNVTSGLGSGVKLNYSDRSAGLLY